MRTFQVDSRLAGYRLHPIGSTGNTVFVKVSKENSVEIWSFHTLFPGSWKKIFEVELLEVFYCFPAFAVDGKRIYLIVFGTALSNQDEVNLYEINWSNGDHTLYCLDPACSQEFYSLPFETACLSHGKRGLHLYDRGIVMGNIPYWYVDLREATFTIRRQDIREPENLKCGRFPIAIDSGQRLFARLLADNRLVVSREGQERWQEYLQSTESHFNLCDLDSRGIRETFSRGGGHRVGAVQSPLTIVSDGTNVIAKVTSNQHKLTAFYRITLDHKRREFACIPAGRVRFTGGLEQMFYPTVTSRTFIAVGVRVVGVVQLQPQTLSECALWALQRSQLEETGAGVVSGGYSFDCLKATLGSTVMNSFAV